MIKFKKLLAIGLSVAMLAGMAGCGKSAAESENTSGDAAGDNTAAETKAPDADKTESGSTGKVETLTVLMYTDWYKSGWEALEKYINDNSQELGFKLEISKIQGGAQGDQVLQTKFATDDLPDIIQVYKPQWVEAYVKGLDKLVDLTGLECTSEYDQKVLDGTFIYND